MNPTKTFRSLFSAFTLYLAALVVSVTVSTPANATAIAPSGWGGFIGVTPQGHLIAWGNNSDYNPLYTPRVASNNWAYTSYITTPERVLPNETGFVAVSSLSDGIGYAFYALQSNGNLWSWGSDNDLVGDPNRPQPTVYGGGFFNQIREVSAPPAVFMTDVVAVTSSHGKGPNNYNYGMALKRDGTVWKWGPGAYSPVQVGGGFTSIHASFGMKNDGSLWWFKWHTNVEQISPAGTFGPADRIVDAGSSFGPYNTLIVKKADGTYYTATLDFGKVTGDIVSGNGLTPGAMILRNGEVYNGTERWYAEAQYVTTPTNVSLVSTFAMDFKCSVLLKNDGSVTAMPIIGVEETRTDTSTGACGVGINAPLTQEKTVLPAGSIRTAEWNPTVQTVSQFSAETYSTNNSNYATGWMYVTSVDIKQEDVGKNGAFFVAVIDKNGQIFTMNEQKGWAQFSSCDNALSFKSGVLTASASSNLLEAPLPQTSVDQILPNATFWVGYGVGNSVKESCENMLPAQTIKETCKVGYHYVAGKSTWGKCL